MALIGVHRWVGSTPTREAGVRRASTAAHFFYWSSLVLSSDNMRVLYTDMGSTTCEW
jgi:hypothetical protein